MHDFEFYRFRFCFRALDPISFPPGLSGNAVRGAFGLLLKRLAPVEVFERIYRPAALPGNGPSGLSDLPRPFVFRAAHLDGRAFTPGDTFSIDAHVFDLARPVLPYFIEVFTELVSAGLGPERGGAQLAAVEQLDLAGHPTPLESTPGPPSMVSLDPESEPVATVRVRFASPTELKSGGQPTDRPEFAILFARVRDRIATLRALYGGGPLPLDFRRMGERAAQVALTRCDLTWEKSSRRSTRTGQRHPLGGFLGEAEYQGVLTEFVPWLRAARWTGVGRQTVWGKGDLRVIAPKAADVR